ncbi:13073_t:CDS:2 [Funneliformis mosseae]|uniref:13073_t:CDS:1 n=1 Tax=Funneliformis mosseae TaxID=27381 RepID=A0A9N9I0U6_FUNMO|nr:13073_t:CDS:2 [Funneliformis mosseae]
MNSLEKLENLVKLIKSDNNKPLSIDFSDSNFPSRSTKEYDNHSLVSAMMIAQAIGLQDNSLYQVLIVSIVTRINEELDSNFLGYHCKEKFRNLIRDYNTIYEYMNGSQTARRSQAGARYFDEFHSHFWERPEDPFDRIRNMNIFNRRRSRRGSSLAPSIEEVEQALSQRSSSQRNDNTGNSAEGGSNITTSSVQQPSYEANQQSSNSADDEVTLRPGNNVGQ